MITEIDRNGFSLIVDSDEYNDNKIYRKRKRTNYNSLLSIKKIPKINQIKPQNDTFYTDNPIKKILFENNKSKLDLFDNILGNIYKKMEINSLFLIQGPSGIGKTSYIRDLLYKKNFSVYIIKNIRTIDGLYRKLKDIASLKSDIFNTTRAYIFDDLDIDQDTINNMSEDKYKDFTILFDILKSKYIPIIFIIRKLRCQFFKYIENISSYLKLYLPDINMIKQIDPQYKIFNDKLIINKKVHNALKIRNQFLFDDYTFVEWCINDTYYGRKLPPASVNNINNIDINHYHCLELYHHLLKLQNEKHEVNVDYINSISEFDILNKMYFDDESNLSNSIKTSLLYGISTYIKFKITNNSWFIDYNQLKKMNNISFIINKKKMKESDIFNVVIPKPNINIDN